MPAADLIHGAVKNALLKDGWTITHDPFTIVYDDTMLFADLAADRPLGARRGHEERLIEIKTFGGQAFMREFERALGQYLIYRTLMKARASRRKTVLAISLDTHKALFSKKLVALVLREFKVSLLVVDVETEEVIQWIN